MHTNKEAASIKSCKTIAGESKLLAIGVIGLLLGGGLYWMMHNQTREQGLAHAKDLPREVDYQVVFDAADGKLTLRHPGGKKETLNLADITKVAIIKYKIQANGSQYEFTNWVLHHSTGKMAFPYRAMGADEMLRICADRIPGFDLSLAGPAITASIDQKEGTFIVWQER
jgi:hypothetical protein